ncbi:MAG: hypothetical protein A3B86_03620 [Candidatus Yanofskybacteria bacterium RIFCSPHIGHO2_02_FULL_38_22b]|uniref:Uncharacterized protein n=1 Tax=Candidatus Yanofskybacteria bacterium RIFCSPHIGHO2_02_FULL_38_22b TaxID=1802673 RepID=A0A1F8F2K3_9BACT|nr:MAG: hypothetical protein A3B86_03620 [Candidatus Yanofskybacteria bacterium RIFCSPHIGHO2_02_FULL_38_22b]OGN19474.1 MAG: hypothetical protein A2910_03000 [Candidatus Yanofskybacteria bacterium RIFCSPLOWO2_01_FULL_39_28]
MIHTELITITLTEGNTNDENLTLIFNEKIEEGVHRFGEYKGSLLLSDYTNLAGSRFVKFFATFAIKDMPGFSPSKKG